MRYLHEFDTVNNYDEMRFSEKYEEPWVSLTNENSKVNYNITEEERRQKLYSTPLTFEITGNGNIYWKAKSGTPESGLRTIEYKKNNDEWKTITSSTGGVSITVSSGDTVLFRAPQGVTYTTLSDTYETANFFSGCTCVFNVKGNVMSLLNANNFHVMTSLTASLVFTCLFRYCTGLTDASKLILPADNLTFQCYRGMFANCSNLVGVPKLPAMNLGEGCYNGMFQYCHKLTDGTMLPELPATTLKTECYDFMFAANTGLTDASELVLPATTLADSCYQSMFYNCTSLTTAPSLPATTLAQYCYRYMFQYCRSLTTAPELPATTLAIWCYHGMFSGCTNLNYIKCLATDISASGCTTNWVSGVASSGTFVKNPSMTGWSTGTSGIPTGWTVQDAS